MANEEITYDAEIPFEMIHRRFTPNNKLLTDPRHAYLGRLDSEMKEILYDKRLAPNIKYRKYLGLLTRFRNVVDQLKMPVYVPIRRVATQPLVPTTTNAAIQHEHTSSPAVSHHSHGQGQSPNLTCSRPPVWHSLRI